MLHALRHPDKEFAFDELTMVTMFAGHDTAGRLLEIGVADLDIDPTIVHAMRCRPKFNPYRSR